MADTIVLASPGRSKAKSRSTTGCWTCRVRRKKCDEKSSECVTCRSLRLDCGGYGPKPAWMDGGVREKEKAEEIKAEVNRKRKRGPQQSGRRCSKSCKTSAQSADIGPPTPRLSTSSNDERGEADSNLLPTPDGGHAVQSGESLDVVGAKSPRTGNDIIEMVTMPDDSYWSHATYSAMHATDGHASFDPMADGMFAVEFDSRPLDSPWDFLTEANLQPAVEPIAISSPARQFGMVETAPVNRNSAFEPSHGAPGGADLSNIPRLDDDADITYYLNHVVPSVFPFLSPHTQTMLRTAILTEDSSSALLRHSTLAHCLVMRRVGLERMGLPFDTSGGRSIDDRRRDAAEHARSVLRQIDKEDVHAGAASDAQLAFCVLQLLLLQIPRGFSDRDGLSGLMEAVVSRSRSRDHTKDLLAAFACSSIITVDILWAASKRHRPMLTGDVSGIAHFVSITRDMHQTTGSEPWVFQYIAEITLLRVWKEEGLASQSLNVVEMVKRATKLAEGMQSYSGGTAFRLEIGGIDKDVLLITNVYAAAVNVYLHVVLSGAHPEVSDIRDAVNATVKALKALTHAPLVRRLAWPICVAASLTEPRHEPFFDQLERGAQGDQDGCSSVLRALKVAKECRRLREGSTSKTATFDWMDAMESLGHMWIMF